MALLNTLNMNTHSIISKTDVNHPVFLLRSLHNTEIVRFAIFTIFDCYIQFKGNRPAIRKINFKSLYPASVRHLASNPAVPHDAIGLYVSIRSLTHSLKTNLFGSDRNADFNDDAYQNTAEDINADIWEEARAFTQKVAEQQSSQNPFPPDMVVGEHLYRLFPGHFKRMISTSPVSQKQKSVDMGISNRGACRFFERNGAEERKFELTETYYGVPMNSASMVFVHYLVSVHGKLCLTMTVDDNIVNEQETQIYKDCITEVLQTIDLD